jgi:hypothetical protein
MLLAKVSTAHRHDYLGTFSPDWAGLEGLRFSNVRMLEIVNPDQHAPIEALRLPSRGR